jgi:hypothetical protein
MNALNRAVVVAATTFAASLLGMGLQLLTPAHTLGDSKATVGAMIGLFTLLLALVLGLLIWTAFSVYATQQSEAQSLGPVAIELDVMMEKYGPEGELGRREFRAAVGRSRARFFGAANHTPRPWTIEETRATVRGMSNYFDGLQPATEAQKQYLATARQLAATYAQTNMLMARQLSNPVPHFLLIVVVCWSTVLFFANGLIAAINPITVGADLAGAAAIASAIFLILELSQPYSGVFRLSSTGIDALQKALEQAAEKKTA